MITNLFKIYVIIWCVFTIWNIIKFTFKETLSMQRWLFVITTLGIFGILTQWIMFFPAWWMKEWKFNLCWWWLDDSRYDKNRTSGLKKDFEIHLNGRKETILVSWNWHIRNMIWNLNSKFKPIPQTINQGNQNIYITHLIEDTIRKIDGTPLDIDGIYAQSAGLKYWKDGVSTHNTNNGEQISKNKSILGTAYFFYKNGGQKQNQINWHYTSCKLRRYWLFWKRWRTIKLGMNQNRYIKTLKYQRPIEWK